MMTLSPCAIDKPSPNQHPDNIRSLESTAAVAIHTRRPLTCRLPLLRGARSAASLARVGTYTYRWCYRPRHFSHRRQLTIPHDPKVHCILQEDAIATATLQSAVATTLLVCWWCEQFRRGPPCLSLTRSRYRATIKRPNVYMILSQQPDRSLCITEYPSAVKLGVVVEVALR